MAWIGGRCIDWVSETLGNPAMSDKTRRIPPLPREQWTDEAREVLAVMGEPNAREAGSVADIVMVMANHPSMGRSFLEWSKHPLRTNSLPFRLLEMLILRVACRTRCGYEWHNHVRYALGAGLSLEDIAAIRDYPVASDRWSEPERLILQSVDELFDDNRLSDETWEALGDHFDVHQKMDVVMTTGSYTMTAWAISSFGVQLEPDVDVIGFDLGTKSGAPPEPRAKFGTK
jgi:4-carboxymuconolactone decarboxylase